MNLVLTSLLILSLKNFRERFETNESCISPYKRLCLHLQSKALRFYIRGDVVFKKFIYNSLISNISLNLYAKNQRYNNKKYTRD